jgi:hypothetical protein
MAFEPCTPSSSMAAAAKHYGTTDCTDNMMFCCHVERSRDISNHLSYHVITLSGLRIIKRFLDYASGSARNDITLARKTNPVSSQISGQKSFWPSPASNSGSVNLRKSVNRADGISDIEGKAATGSGEFQIWGSLLASRDSGIETVTSKQCAGTRCLLEYSSLSRRCGL